MLGLPRRHAIVANSFAIILFLVVCKAADAQLGTGTVNGTVTDTTGAAIQGASLTLTNDGTNVKISVMSNAAGHFSTPEVPIGRYSLNANAVGFGPVTRKNIEVSVGAQLTLDFSLAVGTADITVDVRSTAVAQVNSTSGEQSTLIDPQQMRDLPLNGRNFEQLILLSPGVQVAPAAGSNALYGRSPSYAISGARPEGQLLLLDGSNIQGFWNRGTGASLIGTSLGVEAIAEFQTIVGIYGAQFGGNGAVINAVTKSGTNSIHGSVYEFVRNSVLDARNHFDPLQKPSFRRNQFGGSIGGPVRKDKTFFFLNYEGLRQQLGITNLSNVPDANAHDGLLPCAIAPGYTCNTATGLASVGVTAASAAFLNFLPLPNGALNAGTGGGVYSSVGNQPVNEDYLHARLDEVLSSKDTASLRYVSDNGDLVSPFPGLTFAGFPEVSIQRNRFFTAENKYVISPNMLNVTRFHFTRTSQGARQVAQNPLYAPLQFLPGQQYGEIILASLSSTGGINLNYGPGIQTPLGFVQNKFAFQDGVYLTLKSQQIQTGVDVARVQSNTYVNLFASGEYTFSTLVSFLTGKPNVLLYATPGSDSHRGYRAIQAAPYIQDDWKVASRLSINLGIRYDTGTNPTESNNKLYAIVNPATDTGFTHVSNAFASNPSLKNIDPRFGFSYAPFGTTTVIRGGFGIFHNVITARSYNHYDISPPYNQRTVAVNPSFPNPLAGGTAGAPSISSATPYQGVSTPYQMQVSLGIQQQLDKNTVLTVSYVGNEGRHLFTQLDENPVVSQICPCSDPANPVAATLPAGTRYFPVPVRGYVRVNPHFSALGVGPTRGTSHYSGLQTSLVRQLSQGVQFQINYTWSKALDYSSLLNGNEEQNGSGLVEDPYNIRADYGPAAYDIRHVGNANVIYIWPSRKGNLFLSGWQSTLLVQLRTGSPYNVVAGFDRANVNNSNDLERLNVVGNPNLGGPVAANPNCAAPVKVHNQAHWYNPCAFAVQPQGTFGNERRDQLYTSGSKNFDLAAIKNTPLPRFGREFNVQFRAEFFNIFNHTNLGFPNFLGATGSPSSAALLNPDATVSLNTTAAGQIQSTTNSSRQIQFALKVLF
jgi:hypothetical protein